ALGTLCVIDRVPRTLGREQREALQALGRQVVAQLRLRLQVRDLERAIAERRRAEEALQSTGELQQAILDGANFTIISTTPDGTILSFNAAAERMLGYAAEELVGRATPAIFHDAGEVALRAQELSRELGRKVEPDFEAFVAKARLGRPDENEWTYVRKDGSRFSVRLSVTALYDGEGGRGIKGFLGIGSDITERKEAEEELRASEARYRYLVDHANDIIYRTDTRGRFVFFNPTATRVLEYSDEDLARRHYLDVVHPDHREAAERFYGRQLRERIPTTYYETPVVTRRGTPVWIGQNVQLIEEDGHVAGFQAVARDITERKRAEIDLAIAKEAAEAASRAKSSFLASVSHEIRTPLNAILGAAELLGESPLSEDQRKLVALFRHAGEDLLVLINDLLDLSKIEAESLELERIPFDLGDLVGRVLDLMRLRARQKGLAIEGLVSPAAPAWLVGDPTRLRQVLVNLLGNAVKFTEAGRVGLRVEAEDDGGDQGASVLRFSVEDTGIGIPPENQGSIFDQFTQVDSSTTRKYGGTGLGLAISRRLVELMGGHIWVESALGRGSTFRFTARFGRMPANAAVAGPSPPAEKPAPAALPADRTLSILLVDDSEQNRLVVQAFLRPSGCALDTAVNGAEAVEKFKARRYDVVLMDMQMPVMDGYAATGLIRRWEEEQGRPPTPIIALTARALREELQRCLDSGCTAYLTKPIDKAVLVAAIGSQAAPRAPAPPAAAGGAPPGAVAHVDPVLADLVPDFMRVMRRDARTILASVERDELDGVEAIAHRIKGDGGTYGFAAISSLGDRMERAARARAPREVRQAAEQLETYLDQVEVVFDRGGTR
ncbi:MAG TPA: PAS domain S-box protein, partial [Vicinamibacteria bacterium]|nr:PAS domain S-box protein [Vicinamibacteria bacterium]